MTLKVPAQTDIKKVMDSIKSSTFPAASYSPDADLAAIAEALEYMASLPQNYDRAERIRRWGIGSVQSIEEADRMSEADYGHR